MRYPFSSIRLAKLKRMGNICWRCGENRHSHIQLMSTTLLYENLIISTKQSLHVHLHFDPAVLVLFLRTHPGDLPPTMWGYMHKAIHCIIIYNCKFWNAHDLSPHAWGIIWINCGKYPHNGVLWSCEKRTSGVSTDRE